MNYTAEIVLLAVGLFIGMLLCLEAGRRLGGRHAAQASSVHASFGTLEGATFALLGLLLAFTFSGAASRFDARRHLVVEEANAIGTAYLRLDLLPASVQPALREQFRRYLDARLAVYRKMADPSAMAAEQRIAAQLQNEIWRQAVAAIRSDGAMPQAALLLVPALNAMIDITATRTMSTKMHPPTVIFVLIYVLALISALMAGYASATAPRSWFHWICFAGAIAVAVYVIQDLEYPRLGLIRIDAFDSAMSQLRETMK